MTITVQDTTTCSLVCFDIRFAKHMFESVCEMVSLIVNSEDVAAGADMGLWQIV
jgi:hypothetical protein